MTPLSPLPTHSGQRFVLNAAALVLVLGGVHLARDILIPVLLAVFIANLTSPIIRFMHERKVPMVVATTIALLVDIVVITGIGTVLVTSVNSLYERLPFYTERVTEAFGDVVTWLNAKGVDVQANEILEVFDPSQFVDLFGSLLTGTLTAISSVGLILLILAFVLYEIIDFRTKLKVLMASRWSEEESENPFILAAHDIQRYLGVKAAASLATGSLTWALLAVLGVDFALLWGVCAFIFNFIPNIGSFIAIAPAIVVALLVQGPTTAIIVAVVSFIINFVIGNVIEPKAMGEALGLSPVIVLLSMVFWGWLLGPFGAIISVPLTMLVKIAASHSDDTRWLSILLRPPPKNPKRPMKRLSQALQRIPKDPPKASAP